ncbi:holin-associated N-acetylmuramidase [Ovoidimarina sediminis]|uniref:holin-associated N-acetylmuramidase n=1 Tax=Ovoidimarina sediminis TaxID=3079856 RepID=UPI002908B7D2|nr:holin-associated N-acetylmuramidase [Rhodophyticola sp. MJ-SS7]MDU8942255.1 holin-associated N-acetylmuramidase [Rhodophyticola sp. MJ-SS7]
MRSITDIADEIIAREGGYVNDPDDPGGATKYGVTVHTMRRLGIDLDGDGDADAEDVKRLSRERARAVLITQYFEAPGIGRLPTALQPTVFDMQVNAGSQAIRILQRLLGDMGEPVRVDGILGPQTVGAARRAHDAAPDHIADAYGIERRSFYYRLGDRRPALRKFARRRDGGKGGWITRAETFIAPRFHLSDAEHRARTRTWG